MTYRFLIVHEFLDLMSQEVDFLDLLLLLWRLAIHQFLELVAFLLLFGRRRFNLALKGGKSLINPSSTHKSTQLTRFCS